MSVFIPENDELRIELYNRVFPLFRKIMTNSKGNKNLYDVRACKRLRKQVFAHTRKNGNSLYYGNIKWLGEEAYNMARYFENKANQETMKQIANQLDNFAEFYYYFLL